MVQLADLIDQLVAIREQAGVSVGQMLLRTGNKYSKTTVTNFLQHKTVNPNLETFVDMANAIGADIVLETAGSRRAEMQGDIADLRLEYASKCAELDAADSEVTRLKGIIDGQEQQITKLSASVEQLTDLVINYMARMEKAEDAIYRKDARIVELSKLCGKW